MRQHSMARCAVARPKSRSLQTTSLPLAAVVVMRIRMEMASVMNLKYQVARIRLPATSTLRPLMTMCPAPIPRRDTTARVSASKTWIAMASVMLSKYPGVRT